jgi:hypothetical protein
VPFVLTTAVGFHQSYRLTFAQLLNSSNEITLTVTERRKTTIEIDRWERNQKIEK